MWLFNGLRIRSGHGKKAPRDKMRETTNTNVAHNNDLVLLYSPMKLARLKSFPVPRRFHTPPNDTAATTQQETLIMLAYNSPPIIKEECPWYPQMPRAEIVNAFERPYPDTLSWSEGPTEPGIFDADVVFQRISTFCGASGSGIFDDKGRLVGSYPFSVFPS
jgi:hypothetical protein